MAQFGKYAELRNGTGAWSCVVRPYGGISTTLNTIGEDWAAERTASFSVVVALVRN